MLGCDSERDREKLKEDEKHFHDVAQGQIDALQWQIDDATATRIFDDGTTAGLDRYLTFRKCHEQPPTHEANKRCALPFRHAWQKPKPRKTRGRLKQKLNGDIR